MRLVIAVLAVVLSAPVFAQTPVTGAERLAWEHDGVNVERFEASVDDGAYATVVTTQNGQTYAAPLPAMTPGLHTINVRACNLAGCSAPLSVQVRVVVIPAPISNLRVVP